MWLIANSTSRWMFALGVALMTAILLRRSVRYFRRQKQREKKQGSHKATTFRTTTFRESDSAQPLMDAPPELLRWQVEMHETARDLKAELDSKMSALQTLIQMAREERSQLERALAQAERLGISKYADPLEEIEQLADQTLDENSDPLRNLPPVPTLPKTPGGPPTTRERIYQLADQGSPTTDIADQTGIAVGEVEMILNLRPIRPPKVE